MALRPVVFLYHPLKLFMQNYPPEPTDKTTLASKARRAGPLLPFCRLVQTSLKWRLAPSLGSFPMLDISCSSKIDASHAAPSVMSYCVCSKMISCGCQLPGIYQQPQLSTGECYREDDHDHLHFVQPLHFKILQNRHKALMKSVANDTSSREVQQQLRPILMNQMALSFSHLTL